MSVLSPYYFAFVAALWLVALPLRSARVRQVLLLLSSYLFYAVWGLDFLAILIGSSLVNYAYGSFLRRRPTAARLWVGVLINLSILSIFKYLPLLAEIAPPVSGIAHSLHRIVMPIGVSFWTFQALSYLFDLYREEEIKPSLMEFLLYMAFWPTVLSGPVCRLPQMLPQFRQASSVKWEDVKVGARRILIGLTMKAVLAQLLEAGLQPGEGVAAGFDQVKTGWGGFDVWILAIGFAFQLYFDFGGYSNIVIGTARLFGIRLQENFDRPYLSTSPSAFWTRWHMSLSFWIRDYLFLPLAMLGRQRWWRHLALVISMVLFGIWHKGSVLFVLWGSYHGILLVMHRQLQELGRRFKFILPGPLETGVSWGMTFASVSLGWILFRANDLKQASSMLGAVFLPSSYHHLTLAPNFYRLVLVVAGVYFVVFSGIKDWMDRLNKIWEEPQVAKRRFGFAGDSVSFLWINRLWWTTPMVIVFFFFGMLVILQQNSTVAPFIYTLF